MSDRPRLTTSNGAPVADNQNAKTVGPRGPVLLEDYQLVEKLAHLPGQGDRIEGLGQVL